MAQFSKKHYVTIADMLRTDMRNDLDTRSYARCVANMSDMFRRDNAAFDADKFHDACNPKK